MLQNTRGIVLRSVKYGDTSLIVTIFTEVWGIETYIVQGVRTSKASGNKAGFFQPGTLLELVVYHNAQKNMQRIREYRYDHIYTSIQEDIVKNSVLLFCVEVVLRTLPEHGEHPELFDFTHHILTELDKRPAVDVANMPLYFAIGLCRLLGFDLNGRYSDATPYLNLHDGGFTAHTPAALPHTVDGDAQQLDLLLRATDIDGIKAITMSSTQRMRLLEWYLAFMHNHTQHMGTVRSLSVLQAILH
jgi:DNA repair protein RecO (recombination protein O)